MPAVLEGKVALVTGVSHDGQIGQAVAKKLAESGAALAICARTQSNVEARAPACKFWKGDILLGKALSENEHFYAEH